VNILVIEDSRFLRALIVKTLTRAGHALSAVADGAQGVLMARASRPSLILLDMILPGLDGTSVLKQLKQDPSTAQIPVIVVTTLSQANAGKLKKAGAAAYIEKALFRLDESAEALIPVVEDTIGARSRNSVRSEERHSETVASLETEDPEPPSNETLP
jgi:CheY-like chemotaxis protein